MIVRPAIVALLLAFGLLRPGVFAADSNYQITSLSQFRQLDQVSAKNRQTLKLVAVVNHYIPSKFSLYIESGRSASYAMPADDKWSSTFQRGDVVEFTGYAQPGGFSPIVTYSSYRVLRHGNLSAAPRLDPGELSTRAEECSRVRIAGRVLTAFRSKFRADAPKDISLELVVGSPDDQADVTIDNPESLDPAALIGSKVDLEGVVARTEQKYHFLSSKLIVQKGTDLTITDPPRQDLFDLPVSQIKNPVQFRTSRAEGRAHVRGVVISSGSGESFYIQDASRGIFVEGLTKSSLKPGDVVDVVGYPVPGPYSSLLRYALWRKTGDTQEARAASITSLELPEFEYNNGPSWLAHDGHLVEIEGELIGQRASANETSLLLRLGKSIFTATLQKNGNLQDLETGSVLKLVGVCTVFVSGLPQRPDGMQLLLRSSSDIQMVRTPPWWTGKRLKWVLIAVFAGICLLAGWIYTLRMQVQTQTAQLLDRATKDGLTRIWNRSEILSLLRKELEVARRTRSPLTVLLVDLDHFKLVNDTFGHQAGDAVLVEVCARLRLQIRPSDAIGRYGGEELLAVLPAAKLEPDWERLEAMRLAVADRPVVFNTDRIPITCSLGVSWSPFGEESAEELIRLADEALYRAKRLGRNRVELAGHPEKEVLDQSGSTMAAL